MEGSRNPSLPLTREVARRAGGREKLQDFYLRCGNEIPGSLPQSAALTAPSSEGAKGWVSKACIVRGAKGWKRKTPSDEGGGPKGRRERKCFDIPICFRKIRNNLSPSQLR